MGIGNGGAAASILGLLGSYPWIAPLVTFICSLIAMLVAGDPMIVWLRQKRWRRDAETWTVREDTPETHQAKQGTPSMGGIGLIGAAVASFATVGYVVPAFICAMSPGFSVTPWQYVVTGLSVLPLTTTAHAVLGFCDDWSKATGRGGLRARAKFTAQMLLAVVFTVWVALLVPVYIPRRYLITVAAGPVATLDWNLGLVSFGVLVLVLVATCNAANLTDGIDGLAAGLAVPASLALINCARDPQLLKTGILNFCAALAGACLGFLWYNKHPAKVFMGDTGSLAIGAALGAAAIMLRATFLLPFIGFIFYVEMLSVVLQVAYFKWTKRRTGQGQRILRRAPLHHHFELGGWSEWRVVGTFWMVNLATTMLGLLLWHKRLLPRWP